MKLTKVTFLFFIIGTSIASAHEIHEDSLFSEAGFRYSFDEEDNATLNGYEVYGLIDMWSWTLTDSIRLDVDIMTAIGVLDGEGDTAVYGHIGPSAEISFGSSPVSLIISSGPSLYSEDEFGDYDIGGPIQFTSAIGFKWYVCEKWTIGYQFQHISNAHIYDPNPGIDMHAFNIGFRF